MNLNQIRLCYSGSVNVGILKIVNRKQFDKEIGMFEGKEVEIFVRKKRRSRSNFQNRYYWGAVIPIVKSALYESGIEMNASQVHDLLKHKCNLVEYINEKTGELLQSVGSTSGLTTSEFMDYIASIKNWSREFLNIEIPEPGEIITIEFN